MKIYFSIKVLLLSFSIASMNPPVSVIMNKSPRNKSYITNLITCAPTEQLHDEELRCRMYASIPLGIGTAACAEVTTIWSLISLGIGAHPCGLLTLLGMTMCAGALPIGGGIGYYLHASGELSHRENHIESSNILSINT